MTRLNSITVDMVAGPPPRVWSGPWVRRRLVEAYAIERRLPAAAKIARQNTTWPAIQYEFSDMVGWTDARERILDDWAKTRDQLYASEIDRMQQAQDWLLLLKQHPIERTCLGIWAAAIGYRLSLRRVLHKRGYSRTTLYRGAWMGSELVAQYLTQDHVPVN